MAPIERVINDDTNHNKENCEINNEKLKSDDFPPFKMIRQSLTTIFRENKRKETLLSTLHTICEATESLTSTNRETIDSSTVSINSKAVKKTMPANASNSTIAGQNATKISSKSGSVNHQINQSKTVLQKNVTKAVVSALGTSDSSHRKFKNPESSTANKFQCKKCDKSFSLKTTLIAHEKIHIDANSNCPHCQRTFEKSIALSKHLRENCTKISAAAKKKLLEKDEDELNQTTRKLSDLQLKKSKSRNLPLRNQITGIYHAPKKIIKCIHCGDTFLDVVLFATHAELHANKI